jgi:hypothetical protein
MNYKIKHFFLFLHGSLAYKLLNWCKIHRMYSNSPPDLAPNFAPDSQGVSKGKFCIKQKLIKTKSPILPEAKKT